MKRALFALSLLAPVSARAGDAIDLQQFKPAPGAEDVLAVESANVGDPGSWHSFLALHYANLPFRLVDTQTGKTAATIVGHQTAGDLGGSWVFAERYEIGAVLPVTINQSAGDANDLDPRVPRSIPAQGFGDLRLVPKARFLERGLWTVSASAPLSLPTGGDGFLGRTGPTLRPRALASFSGERRTEVMGMGGLVVRSNESLLNFDQGLALEYGLGASYPFAVRGRRFAAVGTLAGEFGLASSGEEERPMELLAGVRWISTRGTRVTLGGGPGLTHGAGTPEYRLLLMVSQGSPRSSTRTLPPESESSIKIDRDTLKLLITEPVYFGTDNDLIEPRSYALLQEVARVLRENPWIKKLRVEGHTDSQGGEQYNLNLSQLRAISIARFLVKNGADPDTVESKGYGLTRPVDTNETEAGRAKNRRVEFVILEIDDEIAPSWAKAALAPPAPKPEEKPEERPAETKPESTPAPTPTPNP